MIARRSIRWEGRTNRTCISKICMRVNNTSFDAKQQLVDSGFVSVTHSVEQRHSAESSDNGRMRRRVSS
jgi:hypothetical protein